MEIKTKHGIAVACNNQEEFDDAQKIIYPNLHVKWSTLTGYPGEKRTISRNGWCGEKWFRERPDEYTVLEYSDWKKTQDPQYSPIINNYQIY